MFGFVGLGGSACGSRNRKLAICRQVVPRAPLDDGSVPEGHRGLHDALYSGGAEAEHGSGSDVRQQAISFEQEEVYEYEEAVQMMAGAKVAGVYAVQDTDYEVMFVGITRDVKASLRAHRTALGEDKTRYVQIESVGFPSRDEMESIRNEWIEDLGEVPPGNGTDNALWISSLKQASKTGMTSDEQKEYATKKSKLQKAMAVIEEDEPLNSDSMRRAVEDDDWSAAVDEQTKETIAAEPESVIVSPFAKESATVDTTAAVKELNMENCNLVLDEVRPYLVADGGNVRVLKVDDGDVQVLLEGACGSCPSSTTTMKLGIEKVLQENFVDFKSVSAVSDVADALGSELTVELCDHVLEQVRPAIVGLGGVVKVLKAEDETIELQYTGPEKLAYGIELMLRDKFPNVKEIEFKG
ncbi:hypothetical protein NDN08_000681 [Rhodosorus marinus]|uniref:GIY-YIG domain-containing protein n=1 Tax=Rhodosorus marinus TaxID=101924 RepID=A0AAV8UNW9_9RHOD|nr:hypothetical protein NDN08_000681 [Rhodosorus marinus]